MASKSPDAFRTISEVADWLETPAHVLRFWESKFTQVKPVKRAGGRRYYRPADMQLLGGIKRLLHDDGMTIKGVQKLLREHGVKHVAALSPPLDGEGPTPPPAAATVLDFPTGGKPAEAPVPEAEVLDAETQDPPTAADAADTAIPPGDDAPAAPLEDVHAAGFERDDELDSDIPEPAPPTEGGPEHESEVTAPAPDAQEAAQPDATADEAPFDPQESMATGGERANTPEPGTPDDTQQEPEPEAEPVSVAEAPPTPVPDPPVAEEAAPEPDPVSIAEAPPAALTPEAEDASPPEDSAAPAQPEVTQAGGPDQNQDHDDASDSEAAPATAAREKEPAEDTSPQDATTGDGPAPDAPDPALPGFLQPEVDRIRPTDPADGGVLTAIVTRSGPVRDPQTRAAIIAEAQKLAALRARWLAARREPDKK